MAGGGRGSGQTTEWTTGKQRVVVASPEVHCNSSFTLLLSDSYGRRSGEQSDGYRLNWNGGVVMFDE